jgi:hypothetical protein
MNRTGPTFGPRPQFRGLVFRSGRQAEKLLGPSLTGPVQRPQQPARPGRAARCACPHRGHCARGRDIGSVVNNRSDDEVQNGGWNEYLRGPGHLLAGWGRRWLARVTAQFGGGSARRFSDAAVVLC